MASNGLFLPYRPKASLPGQGWVCKVISADDLWAYCRGPAPAPLPIATIAQYHELVFSPEVGDVGAGSITIALTAPVWTVPLRNGLDPSTLRDRQHLWCVYQDGLLRGEFLGQKIAETIIDTGGEASRAVTISGPGLAQTLDWASVFTPYYPKKTPAGKIGVYQFKDQPVMASWLTLLGISQKRQEAPWIQARFSAAKDTGGVKWEDTFLPPPSNTGTALLAGDVLFATDQFTLTAAGQAEVAAITKKIAKITYPAVTVVGHADARGSTAHNYQIALDRANSVANKILETFPDAVMTVISKGESQPRATNRTAAGQSKNRRVEVTYQKQTTSTAHSFFEPDKGVTLLALLQSLTGGDVVTERSPIHVEWIMLPKGKLAIQRRIGRDRSTGKSAVVFHEGSSATISTSRDRDREKIRNFVAVHSELDQWAIVSDKASRDRWRVRSMYYRPPGTFTAALLTLIAKTQLAMMKDEDASYTVAVQAATGRRPFYDFGPGDSIGLMRFNQAARTTLETHRCRAISVKVDADANVSYELTLETTRASKLRYLQQLLDAMVIKHKSSITAFISDDEPTGGTTGDLWTPWTLENS